eukprot:TRINITY_DN74200_c0_g1_i1.p1 TRINITY_DN74200_c0_g1~~TRINITY_DN74200_c0_g1_i1.p1  ORF type:complete len:388 (-),score=46.43 TRINITY_DN74200_c0_g1_i1:11-1141(-)
MEQPPSETWARAVIRQLPALLPVDDLFLLEGVSRPWRNFVASVFRPKLQVALEADEEGHFPVVPRPVPRWGTRKASNSVCGGLLAVGDAYPIDGPAAWYSPNTTCNCFPVFLADELREGWRHEISQPTTLCCELGSQGFFPVIDWKGSEGLSGFARRRRDITEAALAKHGARRRYRGSHLTAFVFYYSPYSLSSFAYMVNRIGQLQACLDKDIFEHRIVEDGQLGDECWNREEMCRQPRFERCPMVLVEVDGVETREFAQCSTRQVPVKEAMKLARKMCCPLLRQATAASQPLGVLAACREAFQHMETVTQLRPHVTERRTCPMPRYPSSMRNKSDFKGSIEYSEVTAETWADHFRGSELVEVEMSIRRRSLCSVM